MVELARALIRLDTSNPPGNETPAAELLAAYLGGAGVECELVGPDPARLNLVARIEGSGEGPSLMLMAHTDVVPAPAAGWTVPPFEAVLRDGRLIGRGATDMKNELAARAVALAAFARGGGRPAGDVVLVAESDEERNTSDVGMSWLVRERPDLRCDFALNEGGGTLLELADGRADGHRLGRREAGHLASRPPPRPRRARLGPGSRDNPLAHAASAVQRLLDHRAPARITPSLAAGLDGSGRPARPRPGGRVGGRAAPAARRPAAGDDADDGHPDRIADDRARNVIPPFADVICDCRALPGDGEEEIREQVERALGTGIPYELELLEPLEGGTESPIDTPLYRASSTTSPSASRAPRCFPSSPPGSPTRTGCAGSTAPSPTASPRSSTATRSPTCDAAHAADEAIEVDDLPR